MADKAQADILIVDDEPELREILQSILSRKYALVEGAENGAIALNMLKERHYNLLIVDLNMPVMGGKELVDKIRKNGNQSTAIIILTGHGTFKEAQDLLKGAGISDFLNKPIDRAQLLFSVTRALREQQLTSQLEEIVENRTSELRASQAQLIQAEKMAALGDMIAGVAHEITPPIGTAMMGISHLQKKERTFSATLTHGIKKCDLDSLLETIRDITKSSKMALGEANKIISSFKQLAVDHNNEKRREFSLAELIEGVITNLQIDKTDDIRVIINCPKEIILESFPRPLGQILTHLMKNTLHHGFENKPSGTISIDAIKSKNSVTILYSDNGIGMDKTTVKKIFDPFFSKKINHGSSGIGMSISFNLITELLNGSISCQSTPGEGAAFTFQIPLIAE